jgi:2-C-methyl-D-erythritol 2,4-cyclodiphosphate synthase
VTEIIQSAGWLFCSAVGQDSHRFMTAEERALQPDRFLVLAGIPLADEPPLAGNSDADVVLHALTNALSGLTTRNILGRRADILCQEQGITDSSAYLGEALQDLRESGWVLVHLSFSIEAARPRLAVWIDPMRRRLAELTGLAPQHIGLTATSGEGLTAFGRGEGIQVFCLASARCPEVEP